MSGIKRLVNFVFTHLFSTTAWFWKLKQGVSLVFLNVKAENLALNVMAQILAGTKT